MFFVDETVPTWVPDVIREAIEKLASAIGLTPFITFWLCIGGIALILIIIIIVICVIKKKKENKRFLKEKEYQDRRIAAREAEKKEQEERFAANPDPFAEPSTSTNNYVDDEDEYELATEDDVANKKANDEDDSLELFDEDVEEINQQYIEEKDTAALLEDGDFEEENIEEPEEESIPEESVKEDAELQETKEDDIPEEEIVEPIEEQPIVEEPEEPVEEDIAIEQEVPEVEEAPAPTEEVKAEQAAPSKKTKKASGKSTKKSSKAKAEQPVENEEQPLQEEVKEELKEAVQEEPKEAVQEETVVVDTIVADETKQAKKANKTTTAKGKYIITSESERNFRYILKASNGEPLITSEIYVSEESARKGIDTIKRNVNTAKIEIVEDKHGLFSFRVITKQGSRTLATSANYKTKARAVSASESFKRFAASETIIVDASQVTHEQAELYDVEIKTEARGKFNIVEVTPNSEYMYQLLASNGRVIASSQIYKSRLSCKQACDKLREVAYKGDFYIYKDKNEKYQFKLYNKQHRLVLAGEVYDSKERVISVINSIKRFAEKAQITDNQTVTE
ncbi:MAG: YegP family protein [Bacilli bacterium]